VEKRCAVRWAQIGFTGTILFLAGCTGVNPQMINEEFEAQLRAREGAYHLKPDDVLSFEVVGNTEYTRPLVKVTQDGYIDTPLGRFFVSGKTIPEVQSLIKREQREFPTSPPPIVVQLVTQAPEVIYVGGEVDEPGVYTLIPGMSALEAVMQAGGNRATGKMTYIILIRRTADWQRVVRRVDLKVFEEDLVLLPRDIVYVPRTIIANISTFIDQYITRIIPGNMYSWYAAMGLIR
jgi:protein involved in polysaccharide export with SLBB domain